MAKHIENISIVFLWDNFGPTHADRLEAVANHFAPRRKCIGVELHEHSFEYDWISEQRKTFNKVTIFKGNQRPNTFMRVLALASFSWKTKSSDWFICNHDRFEIFALALILRLLGRSVFMMADSKFDDFPRFAWREALKSIFLLPYHGAIACGDRSRDYVRFLGIPADRVVGEYDTLSINRIRELSQSAPAPDGLSFANRDFVVVARLITKKNIFLAIEAFATFLRRTKSTRTLVICGSGPLDADLKQFARAQDVYKQVRFVGFVQTDEISKILAKSLALILPSIEEQFGLVVIEALAMGLPVLLSYPCGARDQLIRNWKNGFVFEPDNSEALARFMGLIDSDEDLWRDLCIGARQKAPSGDVAAFVEGVAYLLKMNGKARETG